MFKFITDYFERKKQAKEAEAKAAQDHVLLIKNDIKRILKKCEDAGSAQYKREAERVKTRNSKCPSCGSTKVNERIKRLQGELNGSLSGSSSGFLTINRGSISGSMHGELDTNEVNKCNECGHEWKKYEFDYDMATESSQLRHQLNLVCIALRHNDNLKNCTFDPSDISEEFSSLEEKKESIRKDNWAEQHIRPFWEDTHLETIDYLMKDHSKADWTIYYDEQYLLSLGFVA